MDVTCPDRCSSDYNPVCGSDGVTYGNQCTMDSITCRFPSITKVTDGSCREYSHPLRHTALCVYIYINQSILDYQVQKEMITKEMSHEAPFLWLLEDHRAFDSSFQNFRGGAGGIFTLVILNPQTTTSFQRSGESLQYSKAYCCQFLQSPNWDACFRKSYIFWDNHGHAFFEVFGNNVIMSHMQRLYTSTKSKSEI